MGKLISEYFGKELIFEKKSLFKRVYELKCEEEIICRLHIKNAITKRAIVEGFSKENIEFYKNSIWDRTINIRNENYELPFATFKNQILGLFGTIFLPQGEQLIIKYDLFGFNYELKNFYNEVILRMKSNLFYQKAKIEIVKKSNLLDKYPWVIALMFLVMLKRRSN